MMEGPAPTFQDFQDAYRALDSDEQVAVMQTVHSSNAGLSQTETLAKLQQDLAHIRAGKAAP